MFTKTNNAVSFINLSKMVNAGKISFALEVQRRSVWTEKQKEDLIDSLIFNFPVPQFFLASIDDTQFVLDGQQRGRTITEFYNNEFALSVFLPQWKDIDGNTYDIAGKSYDELPEEVRTHLNSVNIDTVNFYNLSEDEKTLMFDRLNAGTAFKKIETIRINMPLALTQFVNEMSRDLFFSEKVALSERSRVHFADQELILQVMMMFFGDDTGFTGKEIQDYTLCTELDEDEKLSFTTVLEYVNKVFLAKTKFLKKANVAVIFKVAEMAMENNIDPQDFFVWASDFFTSQKAGSEYSRTVSAGSARKENVQQRLTVLTKAFNTGIDSAKVKRIALDKAKAKEEAELKAKEAQEAKEAIQAQAKADALADTNADTLAQLMINDLEDIARQAEANQEVAEAKGEEEASSDLLGILPTDIAHELAETV